MINPFKEINWHPDNSDVRKFGKTLLIGFTVIALLFLCVGLFRLPFEKAVVLPVYLFVIGIAIFIIAYTVPKAALPFYYLWFGISASIGIVISNLILTVFFYFLFTPFAIIFRIITRRDPLNLKKPENATTYWIEYTGKRKIKDYLKQY